MIEVEVIGGRADGAKIKTSPRIVTTITLEGEQYIALQFKIEGVSHYLYMVAGGVPAEAVKTWMERHK